MSEDEGELNARLFICGLCTAGRGFVLSEKCDDPHGDEKQHVAEDERKREQQACFGVFHVEEAVADCVISDEGEANLYHQGDEAESGDAGDEVEDH